MTFLFREKTKQKQRKISSGCEVVLYYYSHIVVAISEHSPPRDVHAINLFFFLFKGREQNNLDVISSAAKMVRLLRT